MGEKTGMPCKPMFGHPALSVSFALSSIRERPPLDLLGQFFLYSHSGLDLSNKTANKDAD